MLRRLTNTLIELQEQHPLRVAIDGITASGKTTLGNELTAAITERGRPVIRIRMDDFHRRREYRYRQGKDSARGYYEDAYDFDAFNRHVLSPLGPDGDLAFTRRIIDLASDTAIDEPAELAPPNSILIADGSFMQRHHRRSWDAVIFVSTSFEEALRRGIARDATEFGGEAAAEQRYAHRYHAASRIYIDEVAPIHAADFIIDNEDLSSPPTAPYVHVRQDLVDLKSLEARDLSRAGAWFDRGENVSNYGFVALDGDHLADLIQAEHAHGEPEHYLGVSADDGIEYSAIMGPNFNPRFQRMNLSHGAVNGYPDGRWPPGGDPAREESREGNE